MRNLLWRGLALALAGCLSWTLWHWPAPPEPVEFMLDSHCLMGPLPERAESVECLWEGKLATMTTLPDGSISVTTH